MRHRPHAAPARAAARGTRVRRERRHGTGLWRSHRASMEVTAHGDKLRENGRRVDAAKCRTSVGAGIPMAGCASARNEVGGWPARMARPAGLSAGGHGRRSRGHAALCPPDAFSHSDAEASVHKALIFPGSRPHEGGGGLYPTRRPCQPATATSPRPCEIGPRLSVADGACARSASPAIAIKPGRSSYGFAGCSRRRCSRCHDPTAAWPSHS